MKRGEIWWIQLDPTIGSEIQKKRPCVIVNDDAIGILPLRVIVPLTDWKPRYGIAEWMVRIDPSPENKLTKTSAVDCFQVRSVSTQRFISFGGSLSSDQMIQITAALAIVFCIR